MSSRRIYKINELIKTQLGQIIFDEVGFLDGILTIKAVETSPDLHQSVVWFSYIGDNLALAEKELANKQKVIQKELNQRLSLRHVPKLYFKEDKSGDYVSKINQILKEASGGDQK